MIYYIYSGSELIGFKYSGQSYYYHKNIFSDIIGILDSNYNEVVSYEYDSWGAITNIVDNSNINLGTINPFRYRSYYYDEEIKLYYLNSRYYNPVWKRFINADEIITGQDIVSNNLYIYCSNSPVVRLDTKGSRWKKIISNVLDGLADIIGEVTGKKIAEDTGISNKESVLPILVGGVTSIVVTSLIPANALGISALFFISAVSATAAALTGLLTRDIYNGDEFVCNIAKDVMFDVPDYNKVKKNTTSKQVVKKAAKAIAKTQLDCTSPKRNNKGFTNAPKVCVYHPNPPFCTAIIQNGKIIKSSNCYISSNIKLPTMSRIYIDSVNKMCKVNLNKNLVC